MKKCIAIFSMIVFVAISGVFAQIQIGGDIVGASPWEQLGSATDLSADGTTTE